MNLLSIPVRNPAVLSRKIFDDEMVLVNADTALSVALTNMTAVKVWDLVNGKNSVQEIIGGIQIRFRDIPDTFKDDILNLLELLDREGYIGFELNGGS